VRDKEVKEESGGKVFNSNRVRLEDVREKKKVNGCEGK